MGYRGNEGNRCNMTDPRRYFRAHCERRLDKMSSSSGVGCRSGVNGTNTPASFLRGDGVKGVRGVLGAGDMICEAADPATVPAMKVDGTARP